MEAKRLKCSITCLLVFSIFISSSSSKPVKTVTRQQPCKRMVLYFHDILYNGKNNKNATAALVAAPAWGNRTLFADQQRFGYMAVFDDLITLDGGLASPEVGRAQGFYFYNGKVAFTAWLSFTFVFNSSDYKGTITFAGADPLLSKTRDISVVGGTGDFFMARGVATLSTDAYEDDTYFRLRVDVKLYECH